MFSIFMDTYSQSTTPLIHCCYFLIEMVPLFDQSLFAMVDVTDLSTVDTLLQHAPYLVVNRVEVRAVWRPLMWTDESGVSAFSNATVSLARWAGALSCWNTKKSPATERMASKRCCLRSVVDFEVIVFKCSYFLNGLTNFTEILKTGQN